MKTELIDRYIHEVGKRLPAKSREDIQKELRSLIMDELEGKTQGKEPTQDDIVAVLKDMGSPADMAQRYTGKRYIIGPELYDLYLLIVRIVAACAIFGTLIATIMEASEMTGPDALHRIIQFIPDIFESVIYAIGFVTVGFAITERCMSTKDIEKIKMKRIWDPMNLPAVPKASDKLRPAEPYVNLIFIMLGLVLLNLYPNILTLTMHPKGIHIVGILSTEALHAYLPIWDVMLIASIVMNILLIRRGAWTRGLSIYSILLSVGSIAVLIYMISGPALFTTTTLAPDVQEAFKLIHLGTFLKVAFGFGIFGNLINIIKAAKRVLE